MSDIAEKINQMILGFTDVISLVLVYDEYSSYDLLLTLANDQNERIELLCRDTSGIHIHGFGGGLNQFLGLKATDVRSQQLDRVALRFFDREDESTSFDCATAEVKHVQ